MSACCSAVTSGHIPNNNLTNLASDTLSVVVWAASSGFHRVIVRLPTTLGLACNLLLRGETYRLTLGQAAAKLQLPIPASRRCLAVRILPVEAGIPYVVSSDAQVWGR